MISKGRYYLGNFKWAVMFRSEFLGRVVKAEMSSF